MKNNLKIVLILSSFLFLHSCVEPYEFEVETYESVLVVEATLTNEFKHQEVNISRTYPLGNNYSGRPADFSPWPSTPSAEWDAQVIVVEDDTRQYDFFHSGLGKYISTEPFQAEEGKEYRLEIVTANGRSYISTPQSISPAFEIDELYAAAWTTPMGKTGVGLFINSSGTRNSGYYRYEYEETYKFVSPIFKVSDLVMGPGNSVQIIPKTKEEYTCFRSAASNSLIIASSSALTNDRIQGKLLRFIEDDDPVLGQRYSMLVRQFSLSREAYAFYENLKELSESESLFSQIQPGFLEGNISSESDPYEKVIGLFNVSWVESTRTYFNYTDFYNLSDRHRPSFVTYCPLITPNNESELFYFTQDPSLRFYQDSEMGYPSRFVFVRAECVDCTLLGSNVVPDFWED